MDKNKKRSFVVNEWIYNHVQQNQRIFENLPQSERGALYQRVRDSITAEGNKLTDTELDQEFKDIQEVLKDRHTEIIPDNKSDEFSKSFESNNLFGYGCGLAVILLFVILFKRMRLV